MSPHDATVLQVQDLGFAYPGRPLLQGLSLQVRPGVSLLQGGDGAGKTTVLRLLAGALAPQAGTLVLRGVPLQTQGEAYREQVYWVEPRAAGLDEITAADWLAQGPARYPRWNDEALARHVDGFGLQAHVHKPMYQLSTGSQRKVLMAAGLASGAALTLLDEPVAGLDKPSIQYLQHALAEEAGKVAAHAGGRAIVVAHYEALPGVPWRDIWVLPD